MWLKRQGPVDTLCRGEVAEWLNAAVSKTVTSVIPASGVRIPPSPRVELVSWSARRLWRRVSMSASRLRILSDRASPDSSTANTSTNAAKRRTVPPC